MIVKFLEPAKRFPAVNYNMDKVTAGKAEFMAAVNFDLLSGLHEVRTGDYINQLEAISALNRNIREPQLHVTISTIGKEHSKQELLLIAKAWMGIMGYRNQPFLVVFHIDTPNNHVHIISTRVGLDGRRINSGFERIRGLKAMNQIMGLDEQQVWSKDLEKARLYRCSTIAQFRQILERQGYTIKDTTVIKFGRKLTDVDFNHVSLSAPDKARATQLKAIFKKYAPRYDTAGLTDYLKTKMGIELIFHAKDGQSAYGYTVLDHAQKNAYKGSEVMSLKDLLALQNTAPETTIDPQRSSTSTQVRQEAGNYNSAPNFTVSIAQDTDDDQIHGPRRRRKRKARTNSR